VVHSGKVKKKKVSGGEGGRKRRMGGPKSLLKRVNNREKWGDAEGNEKERSAGEEKGGRWGANKVCNQNKAWSERRKLQPGVLLADKG